MAIAIAKVTLWLCVHRQNMSTYELLVVGSRLEATATVVVVAVTL